MKRRASARRSTRRDATGRLALCLGLLLTIVLLTASARLDDDRFSAAAAGVSLGFSLWASIGLLGLRPLSPAMVYLHTLAVFHLGLVLPWAAGFAPGPAPSWLLERRVGPALDLVTLALGAYQLGVTLACLKGGPAPPPKAAPVRYHNRSLYACGLVLMGLGLAALAWGVQVIGVQRLLQATHFETYQLTRSYDPRLFLTSLQVFPMGLYIAAASAPWRSIRFTVLAGGLWCAAIFVLGYRGLALTPALTVLALLDKRGYRLPRTAYAGGLVVLLLAIPAVRAMRENPLANRSWSDVASIAHPLDAVSEMGGSLRPLVHTMELLENEPLRWGSTYWRAILHIVPNTALGWRDDRYLSVEELPPSHWVSRLAATWNYRNAGGIGFSAVAESYMNFGRAGVVAYFLFLGGALVWADRVDGSRPTRLAIWAVALGPLLWSTRNSMIVFFRPAVWGLLAVAVALALSRAAPRGERSRPRRRLSLPAHSPSRA